MKNQKRSTVKCLTMFVLSGLLFMQCAYVPKTGIVIENSFFSYGIGYGGNNLNFTDKSTGKDYLRKDTVSWAAMVTKDGQKYNVSYVSLHDNHLSLEFGNAGVKAVIQLKKENDRITFRVVTVEGGPESLTFLNIPLKLEGMPYEPFAACALSMNLFTHVRQIPALQTHLWATCYNRFGLQGAEVSLLGITPQKILPLIRDVMMEAKEVPHSDKGGAWAQLSKEGYGSYLMNFGTLTEQSVDEWIKMCRSVGFNQIDNHGGGDFFRFGDFKMNPEKWPQGWESFKRINARLHEAGISSIFHTYAFFIDKNCSYVTPVPCEDLGYFSSFTLAQSLGEGDTELVVKESTENISTITGFFVRNSLTLRIGSELIEFKGATQVPPYKFTGLKRGANGTKISSHNVNEKAFHLREMFGRFVPGPETSLFNEIASRTAQIIDECGFDGLYLDAIDGSDILGGEEDFWYYGTKFIFAIAKNLKRPVGMEMSSMSHHWWHYRSRWQAWDRPVRGYKRFVDIHVAAIKSVRLFLTREIKSNENEHGLWRGHTPLINKYASAENGGLLLPLHLGWWGNQTWNPPQVEPTFPDDIEYLCCKMMGNNAGVSMLGGLEEKNLGANPLYSRLIPIIKQYEELRQNNYFGDSIRAVLREPGKEFKLFRQQNGAWNFKPMTWQKHKVSGVTHPSAHWKVKNEFGAQPVMLRIEPLMSVMPYNDPANVVLADFSASTEFSNAGNASGVMGEIKICPEKCQDGSPYGTFSAFSSGSSPREGSWIKLEKNFSPGLDINKNQALGVWINGDGKGELLNLRIESPQNLSHGAHGDHFVKIDFKGWKYFELVEIESSEYSNYMWPDSGFYVYDSYRHGILFNNVSNLLLWYNNLPAYRNVMCGIGAIKALPMVSVTIENPSLVIGNERITFPVRMESGMFLEFCSPSDCKLYGPKGEFLQEVQVEGDIPVLKEGENEIAFHCKGPEGINSRVQVTVISEGNPLIK